MATFTGTSGPDVANATTGTLMGFTGGTVEELQDGTGDSIDGLAGNDTIAAGTGGDTLTGGLGVDTVSGGAGNDVLVVENDQTAPGEIYDGGDGFDTLTLTRNFSADSHSFQSSTLNSIEALTFVDTIGGAMQASFTPTQLGTGLSSTLAVTGRPGRFDTIRFDFAAPGSIDLSGWTFGDWSEGEDAIVVVGSSGVDTITGSSQGDILHGASGNDTLNGGTGFDELIGGPGHDVMRGGPGPDLYNVDSAGDQVIENPGEGLDSVDSSISYTLPANVENLFLVGTAPINGTGNALDNHMEGNDNANLLNGGSGNDFLAGRDGNDTLQAGTGNDELAGEGGNDRLIGGAGNDYLEGGPGDDLYDVDADDVLFEHPGDGRDTVRSPVSWTLAADFEELFLLGTAEINGTGNAEGNRIVGNSAANVLSGLDGNDTLDGQAGGDTLIAGGGNDRLIGGDGADLLNGGTGNDLMQGGAGNDFYVVDSLGDTITESANQGVDSVNSSASIVLASNVENLTLTSADNIFAVGNSLDNEIIGHAGNNVLLGEGGNDRLTGNDGNDELNGGVGNDTLNGGAGNDFLSYFNPAEGGDTIQGFNPTDDTLAFLSAGFNNYVLVPGVTLIIDNDPQPSAALPTLLYDTDSGDLLFDANGSSAGGVVQIAQLVGAPTLASDDFLIV